MTKFIYTHSTMYTPSNSKLISNLEVLNEHQMTIESKIEQTKKAKTITKRTKN